MPAPWCFRCRCFRLMPRCHYLLLLMPMSPLRCRYWCYAVDSTPLRWCRLLRRCWWFTRRRSLFRCRCRWYWCTIVVCLPLMMPSWCRARYSRAAIAYADDTLMFSLSLMLRHLFAELLIILRCFVITRDVATMFCFIYRDADYSSLIDYSTFAAACRYAYTLIIAVLIITPRYFHATMLRYCHYMLILCPPHCHFDFHTVYHYHYYFRRLLRPFIDAWCLLLIIALFCLLTRARDARRARVVLFSLRWRSMPLHYATLLRWLLFRRYMRRERWALIWAMPYERAMPVMRDALRCYARDKSVYARGRDER